jgi:hypothetical protein
MIALSRITFAIALMTTSSIAVAGSISPRLLAEMDHGAPGATFSVIVSMKDQADVAALSRQLDERRATMKDRHASVIGALQATARGQEAIRSDLRSAMVSGQILGYTGYWISNLLVVAGTRGAIEEIARRPDVEWVEPNFFPVLIGPVDVGTDRGGEHRTRGIGITPGLKAIRAPEVWRQLGITGAGRLIGGFDTGVDGTHPALADRWRGAGGQVPWQECWLDVVGTASQFPTDTYEHGTHVMGTLTGLGAATGDTIGVAWGAKWIACNACGQSGQHGGPFDNDAITAFQWFADPDGNPNTTEDVPDVVENSWGTRSSLGYPSCFDYWWSAMDNCEAAGVALVFSGGNEGPAAQSMGSPADRPTTLYNAFSVGAVDATHFDFPYPIASFSSRGPTTCDAPPENQIKPEVVGPGVNVYSSIPGGGYAQNIWSGTSMSGPHVAGIIALMRQGNPNLGVDEIKQILMQTARDEGTAGEDNDYGWGMVDAYAAVQQAIHGFGQVQGYVRNGSMADLPIFGATVRVLDYGNQYTTDPNGYYVGMSPAGTCRLEASHPAFRPDTVLVAIAPGGLTTQNFSLIDDRGPTFTNVSDPGTVTDVTHPLPLSAFVSDPSTVGSCTLRWRLNGGAWTNVVMHIQLGDLWLGTIPAQPAGSRIDYYMSAIDGLGNVNTTPTGAPDAFYTYYVTQIVYQYTCETDDPNWSLYTSGDDAGMQGRWVRDDPVATYYGDHMVQPEDDHTVAPGHICFLTGNNPPNSPPEYSDVDYGCTTLTSPTLNLTGAPRAFLSFWRWYAQEIVADDEFQVDASSNGGTTWVPIERVSGNHELWEHALIELNQYITLTNNVKIRFRACDLGQAGTVEACIDDFSVEKFTPNSSDATDNTPVRFINNLAQNEPNPFNPTTSIKFTLSNAGDARLMVFDVSGRLVRVLFDGRLTAGFHALTWDGLDDAGRRLGSGTYFYRLTAGAFEQSRRMTIMK